MKGLRPNSLQMLLISTLRPAIKALLAHGADPNFIMPAPTFSLAFILNSFRHRKLDMVG